MAGNVAAALVWSLSRGAGLSDRAQRPGWGVKKVGSLCSVVDCFEAISLVRLDLGGFDGEGLKQEVLL